MEATGSHFGFSDHADAYVEGADGVIQMQGVKLDLSGLVGVNLRMGGYFVVECIDAEGNLVWETTAENGVTDVGIASILNTRYRAQTQITAWYIGLVDNSGFVTFAASDTMSSHSGWAEVDGANYSDTTRVAWSPGAPSGGAIVNSSSADFHMIPGSPITVYGLFLVSNSTKGGTSGVLEATAPFASGSQQVKNGDTLRATYTMSAASN